MGSGVRDMRGSLLGLLPGALTWPAPSVPFLALVAALRLKLEPGRPRAFWSQEVLGEGGDHLESKQDPSSSYYQELQRNISELFLQIYKKEDFLGLSNIKFSPGSVVVDSTLAFRKGATDAHRVQTQLQENKIDLARYHLFISNVRVQAVGFPTSSPSGPGVPGWGIALLVLVCVLVALAILSIIAVTMCQCRRKTCGQLEIFPTRDAYHPMSEYPTYHTHGRYVPPDRRSPYEEVSAGNGGSGLSYVNPNASATSASL